jgi:hypothetical protein
VLDTLVEIGQISSEAAADAKARLGELQHALAAARSEEQGLTVQAAQLAKDRDVSCRVPSIHAGQTTHKQQKHNLQVRRDYAPRSPNRAVLDNNAGQ